MARAAGMLEELECNLVAACILDGRCRSERSSMPFLGNVDRFE